MDWSERNSCIKCDNGGNLLVCSEKGCPLAVHEGCLGYPAKFDDAGSFYCPYCLYKQAVAEARRARENALARKKGLLVFMEEKVIGSENHVGEQKACEDNGRNRSKTCDENGNVTSSEDGKSKSHNNGITDKPFVHDEEEKICNAVEDLEDPAGFKGDDPSLEMNVGKNNRTDEEKQVEKEEREAFAEERMQEEEHEISAQKQIQKENLETSAEEQIQKEERETLVVEEQMQKVKHETPSASTDQDPSLIGHARANRGSKRSEPVDQDSPADPVHSKRLKQHDTKEQTSTAVTPTRRSSRKTSATMRTDKVSTEEVGSHRRSRKPKELSVKQYGSCAELLTRLEVQNVRD